MLTGSRVESWACDTYNFTNDTFGAIDSQGVIQLTACKALFQDNLEETNCTFELETQAQICHLRNEMCPESVWHKVLEL